MRGTIIRYLYLIPRYSEKATALLPFLELDENYYTISREEANFSTRVQLSPLGTIRLGRSIEEIAIVIMHF